jgi:hypothetical protein
MFTAHHRKEGRANGALNCTQAASRAIHRFAELKKEKLAGVLFRPTRGPNVWGAEVTAKGPGVACTVVPIVLSPNVDFVHAWGALLSISDGYSNKFSSP